MQAINNHTQSCSFMVPSEVQAINNHTQSCSFMVPSEVQGSRLQMNAINNHTNDIHNNYAVWKRFEMN